MKTMSGTPRSRTRRELYVGLSMTLAVSAALQGTGLWLALRPARRITTAAIAAIAGGTLICLTAGALIAAAMLRRRKASAEAAPAEIAVPRPRDSEQAAALAHARKMEALGLLAGGVAHDFNNQLHVIRNSLEILERQDPRAENRRYLEMIHRSADRAGALSRQLLAFSRRQPVEPRPLDPNDLVTQVAELLRHSLGERIIVETVLGHGVADVAADAGQLETALLNLALNARDAMSQVGRLTIETANVTLDESFRSYVLIAVSDTGTGMSPEVAARACEPFFTTKEPGRGTGLGLSQVAGFAQESGGYVRIASVPGKGTTVQLYLPQIGRFPGPKNLADGLVVPPDAPRVQAATPDRAGCPMARTSWRASSPMTKRITLFLGGLLLFACALPALAADATQAQVYQALRGGNVAEAQQMIGQVLRDHPQSGEAHYVAAEVDARAGNFGVARQELQTAESLKPGLPFADPRSVRELQQQLGEAPLGVISVPRPAPAPHSSHVGLFLILIGGAFVLWLILRQRAAAMGYRQYSPQYGVPPPGAYGPGGYPSGYPGGYMPGGGSGIMGSVASGLALGAGVAAGEELVDHMLGGGSNTGGGGFVPPAEAGTTPDPNADMGGNDFGLNDPGSSWDDGSSGGDDGGGWT